jgi:hypothetical protein
MSTSVKPDWPIATTISIASKKRDAGREDMICFGFSTHPKKSDETGDHRGEYLACGVNECSPKKEYDILIKLISSSLD